jgi:hypothetical protein
MSFLEPRSDISICNKSLSRIKQQPLAGALDDPANLNKHAGRECKLWYKTIVRQVLTSHHWGLASTRVALVALSTNNRSEEWTTAYAAPTDMAFPITVGPYSATSTISYYRGLGFLLAQLYGKPLFRYETNTIYANIEGAVVDYVSFNITEQDFNDQVEKLIVLFLASQLARSVAKDDTLARELHDEGIKEMNIEIARSLNIGGPRYGNGMTEAEMVRGGYDPVLAGYGLI